MALPLTIIGVYTLYKFYSCFKGKLDCVKANADHQGSKNVVNNRIHTSNESLSVAQDDIPLYKLFSLIDKGKTCRLHRLQTAKPCF